MTYVCNVLLLRARALILVLIKMGVYLECASSLLQMSYNLLFRKVVGHCQLGMNKSLFSYNRHLGI